MNCLRVSVVMTVYNTSIVYLREAIDSILKQTFSDFEFIIVNDGSTNKGVADTIKSYRDSRIVYIEKENTGISDSSNLGIANARGEYIARIDSDDISRLNRLEVQVKYLDEHPEVSLVGSWIHTFPEERVYRYPEKVGILDVFIGNHFCHSSVMFRRMDFERVGLSYDVLYECAQDYDLWARAVFKLNLQNIPEVLVDYRAHSANITHTKKAKMDAEDDRIKRMIIDRLLQIYSPSDVFETLYDIGKCCGNHFKRKIRLFGILPIATVVYSRNQVVVRLFSLFPVLVVRNR